MNSNIFKAFCFATMGTIAFFVAAPATAANWIQYKKNDNPGYWLDLDSIRQDGALTVFLIEYGSGDEGLSPPTYRSPMDETAYDCAAGVLYHHPFINTAPYQDMSRFVKYYDDNDSPQFMAVCRHIYQ